MYRNSNDKRVRRSADKLYQGLRELVDRQAFQDLSIKDVCIEANVGRATFYRNFDYLEDILLFQLEIAFQDMKAQRGSKLQEPMDGPARMHFFMSYWTEKRELLNMLEVTSNWPLFTRIFHDSTHIFFGKVVDELKLTETEQKYFRSHVGAAITNLLETWVRFGCKESVDELLAARAKLRMLPNLQI